jgi:hypothetical protein
MTAKRGGKSTTWTSGGASGPLAVTVDQAVELLGIPRQDVRRLCRQIRPYVAADGSLRWSYRELCRALADAGRVVGRT